MADCSRKYIGDFIDYYKDRPVELLAWVGKNPLRQKALEKTSYSVSALLSHRHATALTIFAVINQTITEHELQLVFQRKFTEVSDLMQKLGSKGTKSILCQIIKKKTYALFHSFVLHKNDKDQIYIYQGTSSFSANISFNELDNKPLIKEHLRDRLIDITSETTPSLLKRIAFKNLFHEDNDSFNKEIINNVLTNDTFSLLCYEHPYDPNQFKEGFKTPPPLGLSTRVRCHVGSFSPITYRVYLILSVIITCSILWALFNKNILKPK